MNDLVVDPRRLELLLELSRLGSMREVSEAMDVTTSTVSQQIAALAREAGTPLIEPDGRRVRLTPAGRRLAGHAVTVLAALEAARRDLDPSAAPAGTVRVAAFASAVRQLLLPVARILARRQPEVRLQLLEHEPDEALDLLADDEVDLALTYDYNLAPARFDRSLVSQPLGSTRWSLGTPSAPGRERGTALEVFSRYRDHDWIVNSRNTADEEVVRVVASLAGFEPRITHRADSLDLVQDMILAGLGVGLLPAAQPTARGVTLRRLHQPDVTLRGYALTRRGHSAWPPLALVLRLLGTPPCPEHAALSTLPSPEQLVHLAELRVPCVAQPLEQHHLRRHDLRAVLPRPVDGGRPVSGITRAGRVRRPDHPAPGSEQVEHRLQDADVRLAARHDDLAGPGGQQGGKAGVTRRRERRLGQDRLRVSGERRHRRAQARRVLLGRADRHVQQCRRLREPHGPGHDSLVIMDDGHEPLLQVDQQQDGALGGEQHVTDATSSWKCQWSGAG